MNPPSTVNSLDVPAIAPAPTGGAHVWLVLLAAVAIFFGCVFSPPSLMDDVDAAQASIARTMLQSGDWITARLNGVPYLEKPPLKYWLIAISFKVFGDHDWAARIPVALSAVLLCWLTLRIASWGFGGQVGWYAGLCLATCVGLFLFTRVLIADVMVTLAISAAIYAIFRSLEEEGETWPRWPVLSGAAIGAGVLLKGLIAIILPVGAVLLYLALSRQLRQRRTWKRLSPVVVGAVALGIAGFWHIAAVLQNPPYLDFTLRPQPGQYRGFFWFYFLNEHLLRYLGMRYPRDYGTVPRLSFLLFHMVWLFPWSAWLVRVPRLDIGTGSRAARLRLLAVCWVGMVLVFFSLSTTQEYYSMPAYPAFALLLASALGEAQGKAWVPARAVATVATAAVALVVLLLYLVQGVATPGDISQTLAPSGDPQTYTLALGHLGDLTLKSFAYLRGSLALAGVALLAGALACWRYADDRAVWGLAIMMILLAHASRMAMVKFDPYLSSRALAEVLKTSPQGQLVVDDQYYAYSSVYYYAGRNSLLLNGRVNNLEYGSRAPGAPDVFIDDAEFARLWRGSERVYLVAARSGKERVGKLVGENSVFVVKQSGGKFLLTNLELGNSGVRVRTALSQSVPAEMRP